MQGPSPFEPRLEQLPHLADIAVIFNGVESALESLCLAAKLARGLATQINLLVEDEQAGPRAAITGVMLANFTASYFLARFPHAANLQIKVAQYPASTEDLWEVLPPRSIIVMAGPIRRLWPSAEQKFARKLCRAGHEVILVPFCSSGHNAS